MVKNIAKNVAGHECDNERGCHAFPTYITEAVTPHKDFSVQNEKQQYRQIRKQYLIAYVYPMYSGKQILVYLGF